MFYRLSYLIQETCQKRLSEKPTSGIMRPRTFEKLETVLPRLHKYINSPLAGIPIDRKELTQRRPVSINILTCKYTLAPLRFNKI